eukprot:152446-Prymnesium_polylepis.1
MSRRWRACCMVACAWNRRAIQPPNCRGAACDHMRPAGPRWSVLEYREATRVDEEWRRARKFGIRVLLPALPFGLRP